MKPALTEQQIASLFTFVRSKYVRYIDLQYELVDHLATGIEEKLTLDPKLTFQQARDKVYGGFPVTGFSRFVEQQEKALHRYWMRRVWSYIGSYMKLPRVLLTLTIFTTVLAMYSIFGQVGFTVALCVCFAYSIYAAYSSYQLFRGDKSKMEKYLVINIFQGITATGVFAPLALMNALPLSETVTHPLLSIPVVLTCAILTLSFVWSHAVTTHFPHMLREELRTKYAHLNIAI